MLQPQTTIDAAESQLRKTDDQQAKVPELRKNVYFV